MSTGRQPHWNNDDKPFVPLLPRKVHRVTASTLPSMYHISWQKQRKGVPLPSSIVHSPGYGGWICINVATLGSCTCMAGGSGKAHRTRKQRSVRGHFRHQHEARGASTAVSYSFRPRFLRRCRHKTSEQWRSPTDHTVCKSRNSRRPPSQSVGGWPLLLRRAPESSKYPSDIR